MGEVIYLYPDPSPAGDIHDIEEPASLCPNYEPAGYECKSWIYNKAPGICGGCSAYQPERGCCGKLKFKKECVCLCCGEFTLDRPGSLCSKCGRVLVGVTIPSDW